MTEKMESSQVLQAIVAGGCILAFLLAATIFGMAYAMSDEPPLYKQCERNCK
jgi:hypothetical protein